MCLLGWLIIVQCVASQKKKPGVVLKIESTADVLTYTVALKQQGMMVKDNTLLLTLCLKKRTHPWLYDLTTGETPILTTRK